VTTQPDPTPAGAKPARQLIEPLRELSALVLLGANAVLLFVAFVTLLLPISFGPNDFTGRAANAFGDFINLATIGFPVLAVLLAVVLTPVVPRAKLIVTAALAELVVAAFFGVLFGLLVGVVVIADSSVLGGFTALLARLAWTAVLGLAIFVVYTIFRANYYTPRPKPAPGMYGQPQQYAGPPPQYGQPPQYGGPPPAPHQYGQPYGNQPPPYATGPYGDQTAAYPQQAPPPQQAPQQPAPPQAAPGSPAAPPAKPDER
jgi:hypothetical protein